MRLIAATTAATLAGCDAASQSQWAPRMLKAGERANAASQHLLTGNSDLAQEFSEADLSPTFRSNGTSDPQDDAYQKLASDDFRDYKLKINGLVNHPRDFTLDELRAMNKRTQITRHDCVEGWSAIGKWTGVRLATVLSLVEPKAAARYVVFHCADPMDGAGNRYYESIDLDDANHLQTILAYELNGRSLLVANGAPIRVRVERQLGYKMAKYVMRIELVSEFSHIGAGKGGYWEDQGYEWYAGI